jgi:hypothetical protein
LFKQIIDFKEMSPNINANFMYIDLNVAILLCETTEKEALVTSQSFVQTAKEHKARQVFVA